MFWWSGTSLLFYWTATKAINFFKIPHSATISLLLANACSILDAELRLRNVQVRAPYCLNVLFDKLFIVDGDILD